MIRELCQVCSVRRRFRVSRLPARIEMRVELAGSGTAELEAGAICAVSWAIISVGPAEAAA